MIDYDELIDLHTYQKLIDFRVPEKKKEKNLSEL